MGPVSLPGTLSRDHSLLILNPLTPLSPIFPGKAGRVRACMAGDVGHFPRVFVCLLSFVCCCCCCYCCSPRRETSCQTMTPDPGWTRPSLPLGLCMAIGSPAFGSVKFRSHRTYSPPAPAHTDVITGWVGMTGFCEEFSLPSNAQQRHPTSSPKTRARDKARPPRPRAL